MTRTLDYIASLLVIFFGWWLFAGQVSYRPGMQMDMSVTGTMTSSRAGYAHADTSYSNTEDMQSVSPVHTRAQSPVIRVDSSADENDTVSSRALSARVRHAGLSGADVIALDDSVMQEPDAGVSDSDWFSGLMNKARNFTDRIININIDGGSAGAGTGPGAAFQPGTETIIVEDENLPQPTQEYVDESKPDCPSMMYMGGNDYGRNMLIKMGCPLP